MSMLAAPDTLAGTLTAADLDAACEHSTGTVYHLHRAIVMPAGLDQQGRYPTREWADTIPTDYGDCCAPEGGTARDPVESMHRHRATAATVKYGLALAALLAVAGYLAHILWPLA